MNIASFSTKLITLSGDFFPMMLKRVFIIGALALFIGLLATSSADAGTQSYNKVETIPAHGYHTEVLGYLEYDTTVTILLEDATQPIRFYVYYNVVYRDTNTKSNGRSTTILDVYNVQSGNWSFTAHADGDYFAVFVNNNPEPTTIMYSVTEETVDVDYDVLWPIFGVMICITLLIMLIPLVMMVVMVVVIIIIVKVVTDSSKKKQQHYRHRPPDEKHYYRGEEAPRKKKGKSGKKKD